VEPSDEELAPLLELLLARDAPTQRSLSSKLDSLAFRGLLAGSSLADRLRLLSQESLRSAAWLQAMPSRGPLNLTLTPNEMQVLLQHRLGLPLAGEGAICGINGCREPLDLLGHHQVTCSRGGAITSRHNRVRDAFARLAAAAGMSPKVEQGSFAHDRTRPADILVPAWSHGKPAAFDVTIVSPHTQENLIAGSLDVVEKAAELKHSNNDAKCAALGWLCVPLAGDVYGQWCAEAHDSFSAVATRLAVCTQVKHAVALSSIYNTLGLILARQNARAILARRSFDSLSRVGSREVQQLGRR